MSAPLRSMSFEDVDHDYTSKHGEPIPTLRGVSLEVAAQEFVTIVGPSGCGKSTLFNLASGLLRPSAGTVAVNGQPLHETNPYVTYMFQHHGLLDWRTVLDNAILGQEFLGVPKREARREALSLLEVFGLQGFADKRPYELSGGMKQRLALLRTYMTKRQLLLLDEPFGALDALTRIKMQDLLLERWEQDHRTVLFITHDVEEALLLGDRVVVMTDRPGQVREVVPVDIPRPRSSSETVTMPRFVALKKRLLGMLFDADVGVEDGAA